MDEVKSLFREANKKEKEFYIKKLYPLQDEAIKLIDNENFYLSGGTALSRFHYNHRFSDDLDIFFNGYKSDNKNAFKVSYQKVLNEFENVFDKIEIAINGDYFKRIFVMKNNINLKIEFIFDNHKTVGKKTTYKGLLIDSKENICANKIGTVMDRRSVKDYIDLYYLLKDIELKKAIEWSEYKMVPPNYEGLMIGIGDLLKKPYLLEGNVIITSPIEHFKFENFINELLIKLVENAKSR
jgi:predicted nucleotidyltransferase component of viral defense system